MTKLHLEAHFYLVGNQGIFFLFFFFCLVIIKLDKGKFDILINIKYILKIKIGWRHHVRDYYDLQTTHEMPSKDQKITFIAVFKASRWLFSSGMTCISDDVLVGL
jgi:hypothetical protein